MLMTLNDDAIKQYKKNIGITKEYKGNLNLIKWKDEVSLESIFDYEDESVVDYEDESVVDHEDESEGEDVINSDMESEQECQEEEEILV